MSMNLDTTTRSDAAPTPMRHATAVQVLAFARWMASRDPRGGDCWHCVGQRMVHAATGKLRRCGECVGTGRDLRLNAVAP